MLQLRGAYTLGTQRGRYLFEEVISVRQAGKERGENFLEIGATKLYIIQLFEYLLS